MTRYNLLLFFSGLGISLALLHFLAVKFYLYWTLPWFDIPMHFLGGLFVGVGVIWFFFSHDKFTNKFAILSRIHPLIIIIVSVFTVGVLWEVFEFSVGQLVAKNPVGDTLLDLAMDIVGGFAAYYTALVPVRKLS